MRIVNKLHNIIESIIFSIFNSVLALTMFIIITICYFKYTFLQTGINQLLCLSIMIGVVATFIITLFKIKQDLMQDIGS